MRDTQIETVDPFIDPWLARMDARFDLFEARIGAMIDREVRRFLLVVVPIMVLGFAGAITAALVH